MSELKPVFLGEYAGLHPADLADRLQRLSAEEAQRVLLDLPAPLAGRALDELDREKAVEVLRQFPADRIVPLFTSLAPKAIADLALTLPAGKRRTVLAGLEPEMLEAVQSLLKYRPDTAGGVMSDRFIALRAELTLGEALNLLRQRSEPKSDEVSYLYVTDETDRLVGVVPLRDLVFRTPDRRVRDVMSRDVKYLRVDADQEEIARQFEHYHYLALPVLEADGHLVGIVRASDALEIAKAEATEDMQLMVGLSGEERALTPWSKSIGKRLPWLAVNLATAFLAGWVVNLFESTIARWTVLAVFLPIIAGQGGNAAMQSLTVIIRDLALGELSPGDGVRALAKELLLGLVNGIAIGLVVGLVGFFWKGSVMLGVVAGLAMLLNQLAAAVAGVLIPLGLRALRVDPALASSIFATTVTDVAGFVSFLGLAFLALRWFGH